MAESGDRKGRFDKTALTIPEQVELLNGRGLNMADPARAAHYLTFISYYRLSGYLRYYYADPSSKEPHFRPGTSFDDVLNLYIFDRKIRNLLMDALERIEVAVKATISNTVSLRAGPFWISDANNFDYGSHDEIMGIVNDLLGDDPENHQHQYISHYYKNYGEPAYPPSWILMETLSFASTSKIYKHLKGEHRPAVAGLLKARHHNVLESWLHALSFARNVCAHHGRVWNRKFTIHPKIPHQNRADWPHDSRDKLYSLCAMIHILMAVVADGSQWSKRLYELIQGRPSVPLQAMGFPEDWASNSLWGLEGGDD